MNNSSSEDTSGSPFPSRRDLHASRIPSRGAAASKDSNTEHGTASVVENEDAAQHVVTPAVPHTSPGSFPTRREHLIETGALPQVKQRSSKKSERSAGKTPRSPTKVEATSIQDPPVQANRSTRPVTPGNGVSPIRMNSGAVSPLNGRASTPSKMKAKKAPKWRVALILILLLALVGGAVYWAWMGLSGDSATSQEELDFPGPGEGSVEVTITTGELGSEIGQSLVDAGVVKTVRGFTLAFEGNSASATIKPGTYTLKLGMRSADALAALLDEANRSDNAITVNAGQTAAQVYERMISVGGFTQDEIDQALADPAVLGLPEAADGNVEGWLAAGSYEVAIGESATDVLMTMVGRTTALLTDLGIAEADWQETLIKASILEREAGVPDDLPKVARVILNRLELPEAETRGLLQMDSTVLYGVGKSGGLPTAEDLGSDSPYNTYRVQGLPPTPIATPSQAAIEATINPADGDWLYFVTVNLDTGETLFSSTLAEQTSNIELLTQWCEQNEGRC